MMPKVIKNTKQVVFEGTTKVIDSTIEVRNKIHREIMDIEHPKKETKKGIYKLRR